MKQYTVRTVQAYRDHLVLSLQPRTDGNRLQFWPGQYAAIGFRVGSQRSPMRCFSIVSSPHSDELQFAMRARGRFTRRIATLQPGQVISIQGPFGDFVMDPSDKSIIMLAAGIGITPFMSMLRYAAEAKLTTPITLLYGVRSIDEAPFGAELRQLQSQNPNLRVAFVVQQGRSDAARNVYSGRIDEALLQRATGGRFQPYTFFICGPSRFSNQMQRILRASHVVDERIVTEAFSQATKLGWRPGKLSIPGVTYALTAVLLLIGIGGVMAMDLIRYVPQKAAALGLSSPTTTVTPAASTTDTTSPASTDTTTTSTSADNSATSNSTTTTTSPSTTQTYQYQAPMSSVS